MIALDITTILAITALNLFTVSAVLPMVMGKQISTSARCVQGSLVAQASGWACIVGAEFAFDMPLSVLAMACGSLSNYLLFLALRGWLGSRPWRWLLQVACIALPVGYALSYQHYAVRVGWANFWLGLQFLLVARACLWPSVPWGTHWRYLLVGCYAVVAMFTFSRGILGALYTPLYPSFTTPHPINLLAQLVTNLCVPLTTVALMVAWRREAEHKLQTQANTDTLTDLLNRRGFEKASTQLIAQAQRQHWPLAVMMLDLDHFKRVNDLHGHEVGDRALKLFANVVRATLRDSDVASRIGGEEFALLLPQTDEAGAILLDKRLRQLLIKQSTRALGWPLNYSAGLVLCHTSASNALESALHKADLAMYEAKHRGRGQLCTTSTDPSWLTETHPTVKK